MNLNFNNKLLVLAPLAGFTDLPFRSVAKSFGADLTVSEMISSNALVYNSKKTYKMLEKSENETPYSVQLAGNRVSMIKEAVEILNRFDGIDIIDLNCGCPAKKVVNHGSGSTLLKKENLNLLSSMLKIMKETSNKKYLSAKIRLGFEEKNYLDIAKVCEDAGVDFIAVHGRTKQDGYEKSKIDYEAIKEIKKAVSIPVIANGEIDSFEVANYVLDYTDCDGLMIGRGAIGKPWIFHQIKNQNSDISPDLRRNIVIKHYENMVSFYGDRGVILFRKHLHTYSKGLSEASSFRDRVNRVFEIDEMREEIEKFFNF